MNSCQIGLIGLPNAGKSTLINLLVGEKVGIVTAKPQTTRKRVLGILNQGDTQLIFIDPPGKIKSRTGLNSVLQIEFDKAVDESDILLLVLNMDAPKWRNVEGIIELAKKTGKPVIAVITKEDLPVPERVQKTRDELKAKNIPAVAVSAKKLPEIARELILDLIEAETAKLKTNDGFIYNSDIYTTQTSREFVEEILREKCFENVHQEIPYGLTTKVMKFDEGAGRRPEVHCDIIVEKESHVKIVVGRGGENLKRIGTLARLELEKVLGSPLILKTHVRLAQDWTSKPQLLEEFGYVERI